jgi:hypothetical protein
MLCRRTLIFLCVLSLALFGACKGRSDGGPVTPESSSTPEPTATPEGTTVESDDGKLSIFIPKGAMPEGTAVSITSVAHDELPVELSQLVGSAGGYKLEPDGLTLSQPATATLMIDRAELDDEEGTQTAYALVSFNETAGREVLDSDTEMTMGDGSITASAEIEHFSYLTRTKSSMELALFGLKSHRGVGERYQLATHVYDTRPEQVGLSGITGTWLAAGTVVVDESPTFTSENLGLGGGSERSFTGKFTCERPGTGVNGIHVRAVSTLQGSPSATTNLSIVVNDAVECVSGTVPPDVEPTDTPANSPPIVHLEQTIGCEHTNPGVSSELQKRGRITDAAGQPLGGVSIQEEAAGPGLLDDESGRQVPVLKAYGSTDGNGDFTMKWSIISGGPYTTSAVRVRLAGVEAQLDATSTASSSYTVTAVCTPP